MAAIAVTWLGIIAVLGVSAHVNRWEVAPLSLLLLGGLQHRFFTIYHEAFHRTLFANARMNDFAGKWLASYPALARYAGPRLKHLGHHKHAATPADPDNVSYLRSWRALLRQTSPIFAIVTILGNYIRSIGKSPGSRPEQSAPRHEQLDSRELLSIALVQLILLAAFLGSGFSWWSALYWFALLTVTPVLTSIRQWSEHFGGQKEAEFVVTRPNAIERFLFSPMNFNLHEAHHRFPSVSFPHLGGLQAELDKIGTGAIHRSSYLTPAIGTLRW